MQRSKANALVEELASLRQQQARAAPSSCCTNTLPCAFSDDSVVDPRRPTTLSCAQQMVPSWESQCLRAA